MAKDTIRPAPEQAAPRPLTAREIRLIARHLHDGSPPAANKILGTARPVRRLLADLANCPDPEDRYRAFRVFYQSLEEPARDDLVDEAYWLLPEGAREGYLLGVLLAVEAMVWQQKGGRP
jgi:hypothetical protein